MRSVVALLSGGMDSTVLAHEVWRELPGDVAPHFISFNYGQRHKKELEFAKMTAAKLGGSHTIVDLSVVQALLTGSALTSPNVPVPEGHYTAESMKITVVPNRNMIMIALATGYAVSRGLDTVAVAVHAGDHAIYPDCRPEFIDVLGTAIKLGTAGFGEPDLYAPYIHSSKAEIALRGHELGVDWTETWSCYKGEAAHCGKCGTCVERREAFTLAGIDDPTAYQA